MDAENATGKGVESHGSISEKKKGFPNMVRDPFMMTGQLPRPLGALSGIGNYSSLAGFSKDVPTTYEIDYLTDSDYSKYGKRSVGSQLAYNTGIAYLTGIAVGTTFGATEGLYIARSRPYRIKLNSVLNACTRRGPMIGNHLGVIAFIYNVADRALGALRNKKFDSYGTIAAATTTGLLYKSTSSPRVALSAAAIGGALGGVYEVGNYVVDHGWTSPFQRGKTQDSL